MVLAGAVLEGQLLHFTHKTWSLWQRRGSASRSCGRRSSACCGGSTCRDRRRPPRVEGPPAAAALKRPRDAAGGSASWDDELAPISGRSHYRTRRPPSAICGGASRATAASWSALLGTHLRRHRPQHPEHVDADPAQRQRRRNAGVSRGVGRDDPGRRHVAFVLDGAGSHAEQEAPRPSRTSPSCRSRPTRTS